jgi:signal transduction histidine kinase
MNTMKPHLLVVDDDEISRKLLRKIFQRVCIVELAENGRQALEKMVAREYDIVLLDIMMKDLSGLDVLKILRHSKPMLELPVILISAMSDTEEIARGIRLGANDYITKPYDIDIVQARVNTQLHLKKALDERQQAITQLESANKMKSQLMEIASKDIKGPLNNLRMLGTVMRNKAEANPEFERFASIMETNLQTMVRVADSVMEVHNVDKANTPLKRRPLHLAPLIRQVVFQHKSLIQTKRVRVLLEENDAWVLGDSERFQQAFNNILHNALCYSPADSTVTIQVSQKDTTCCVRIIDCGPGIAEEEREHLFQPFSASRIGQQPLNRTEEGKGMGLWFARELMSSQGGSIGMEPAASGGSIFWLELPRCEVPETLTATVDASAAETLTQTAFVPAAEDATETTMWPVATAEDETADDDKQEDTEPIQLGVENPVVNDDPSPTIVKPRSPSRSKALWSPIDASST